MMTELDELAAVRSDVPPMSEAARAAGRARLATAMAGPSPTRRRVLAPAFAAAVALAVAVSGGLLVGASGDQQPMRAADVLNRAAAALTRAGTPEPRADQFFFFEGRSIDHRPMRTTSWTSVDGSKPGRGEAFDESGDCLPSLLPPCMYWIGEPIDERLRFPSKWLATQPDTPGALLKELRAQARSLNEAGLPRVERSPTGGYTATYPARSADAVVWSYIRNAIGKVTSDQQALLFRVGARMKGTTVYRDVTDAEGRVGTGVGMDDPTTGRIILVFDPATYEYLGSVTLDLRDPERVVGRTAVLSIDIVDRVGQRPS